MTLRLRKQRKKFGNHIYSCLGVNLSERNLPAAREYAHKRFESVIIVRSNTTVNCQTEPKGKAVKYDIQPISVWVYGIKKVKK